MTKNTKVLTVCAAALIAGAAFAQQLTESGFMDDYSILMPVDDGSQDFRYLADGALDRVAKFTAVMIDEPEIFISAESPYKGAKPKHLDALGEAIRSGLSEALSKDYDIVEQPGENVMYIRLALSELKLEKRRRGLLGYTPVGLVGGAVVGAASTDIATKANLQDVMLEAEIYDSSNEEMLVAVIDSSVEEADTPASWEELEAKTLEYGELVRCRLNNSKVPEGSRVNCFEASR